MIIVGAKGFAKQVVEVFYQTGMHECVYFFDNVSQEADLLFGHKVVRDFAQVRQIFSVNRAFCLGIGGPHLRKELTLQFKQLGGDLQSLISPFAHIAVHSSVSIGVSILTGVVVENDALIQEGALLNTQASVHHDAVVGAFAEIAPGARILGGCIIGEEAFVGANAVILPKINIGHRAVVGAGAVVTRDVEPASLVVGNPAKHIRYVL